MTRVTRVAPLLLRGRISTGHGLIDLLAIAAFTLSSWLLLVVLAGVNLFYRRQLAPPAGLRPGPRRRGRSTGCSNWSSGPGSQPAPGSC